MKQFIRDYLTFNKRERNGVLVLLTIIALLIVYLNISDTFNKPETVDFTKFEKEIEQYNLSIQHINDSLKNENNFTHSETRFKKNAINNTVKLELNSADSMQLVELKGIGPFYAKTIIRYRNLLGGFVAKEQLMEVWKFDSIKFDGIKKMITVDELKIKKININSCTAKELKHPYLTWNMANGICNYRSKHGNYKTIEDIKKTDLLDDKTYRKIAPYLIIE